MNLTLNETRTDPFKFVWCGTELCEQRDSTGATVTKRFFGEGEQVAGANYFFTRDHLGSVREMTDSSGTIQERYDYDPYGRRTKISGSLDADFAFTGNYYHAASGLYLTLYRAYDSDLGRWLSRDPSGEQNGLNLYAYVFNNPAIFIDLYGLNINWGNVGFALVGTGASLVGLAVGAATSEVGVGVVLVAWSGYSLSANLNNLSNALNGNNSEQTTGLGQAVGEAIGGEGSDTAKAGEVLDLETLLINPEVVETKLQESVENADNWHSAVSGMNDAANGGLWNFLKQLIAPLISNGCPAGSGSSTGDPQKDVWNYIAQLDKGNGLY